MHPSEVRPLRQSPESRGFPSWLSLARWTGAAEAPSAKQFDGATGPTWTAEQAPLVVVVDEDALCRAMIGHTLDRLGFRVIQLDDAEGIREVVMESRPAIVLVSLTLPGPTGLDVIHDLRSLRADLPILATHRTGVASVAERARASGASDILPHPLSLYALAGRVLQLVQSNVRLVSTTPPSRAA